ncbi:uracil-DNA glycosylase family protein [Synergistaceae bacterium OttesenSCG-928-D05]|nr:uracil-DNA glycosylase family protein [Synergistaceae bacterium OttesenSCG-928-D05]
MPTEGACQMKLNVKKHLLQFVPELSNLGAPLFLPDAVLEPEKIKVIMINEVVPQNETDDFYGKSPEPDYLKTTLPLFAAAGVPMKNMDDILAHGIYITNAVKTPKSGYTIETETIKAHLPLLAEELTLFPNLQIVMLMGDVAKKAFNMIAKAKTGKAAIPSGSTYKLRKEAFYCDGVRVFPSYIMTGGNILIEKSKFNMASEDIAQMATLI